MKTVLIILAIIYVAIGLYYWVKNLIIAYTKEKALPGRYNLAVILIGSLVLLFMWVIAWPIIIWKVGK